MSSLGYNAKQGFKQVVRNKGMSIPSVLSIFAMLLILGVFFMLTVNLNLFTESIKQDYDEVEVFIVDNTPQEQVTSIISKLRAYEGVNEVVYRSKEEALKILRERWGESGYLLDSLGENPLPASILITVDNLDNAGQIASYASSFSGIEDVQYYKETVDILTKVTHAIQTAAIVVMAFLIVVCVIVVANTIKLTVNARSKEIQVMKYVGATNWFIRGPFMIEGIILGLFSSLIASGVVTLIYNKIVNTFGSEILTIIQCPLIPVKVMAINILIIFVTVGVSIGAWGSLLSLRRFLKA